MAGSIAFNVCLLTHSIYAIVEKANEYEVSLRRLNSTRTAAGSDAQKAPRSSFEANQPVTTTAVLSSITPTSAGTSMATPQSPPKAPPLGAASRLARLLPSRSASTASAPPTSHGARPPVTPYASYPLTAGLDASSLPRTITPDLNLNLPSSSLASPSPSELSLLSALTHEQSLRKAAESAAAKTNSEIEELTGQLFEQANEMVAQERKARAKLEERVNVLEKREGEKSQRLQTLERRIGRVERVRGLLEREKVLDDTSLPKESSMGRSQEQERKTG